MSNDSNGIVTLLESVPKLTTKQKLFKCQSTESHTHTHIRKHAEGEKERASTEPNLRTNFLDPESNFLA